MAINFEAANMAGYNNPKIEVFAVTLNEEAAIATAPSKSELLNCTQRGSIPFLYITDPGQETTWLLPLSHVNITGSGNYELSFSTVSYDSPGPYSLLSIFYPETGDTLPTLGMLEMPKSV